MQGSSRCSFPIHGGTFLAEYAPLGVRWWVGASRSCNDIRYRGKHGVDCSGTRLKMWVCDDRSERLGRWEEGGNCGRDG